jgi:hypothetical protein
MSISELLLPEYEHEIAVTREVLKRVPDDRGEWKPHAKTFPMAHLAQLVARLPGWVPMMFDRSELDLSPPGGSKFPGYSIEKTATLLAEFDRNAAGGRSALAAASDDVMHEPWTLKRGGQVRSCEHPLSDAALDGAQPSGPSSRAVGDVLATD